MEGQPVLLLIDQLEEVVTRAKLPGEVEQFFEILNQWTASQDMNTVKVIATLRSDMIPVANNLHDAPEHPLHRYDIPAFTTAEWREMVLRPAEQEVLFFESPSLVDEVVNTVSNTPGALPLLSFLMKNWCEACKGDGRELTRDAYERLGKVHGALNQKLEEMFKGKDANHRLNRAAFRNVFMRMVSEPGDHWSGKRVYLRDLEFESSAMNEAVAHLVRKLVDAYLLVSGSETLVKADGEKDIRAYLEPAHEALLNTWRQLDSKWISQEGIQRIQLLQKLQVSLNDYDTHRASKAYLWDSHPQLAVITDLERQDEITNFYIP